MASEFTHPVQVLRVHTTALEAELSVCLADPGPRAVHRLRTETRRVEAQLLLLALLPSAPVYSEASANLRRELRRLRRAAGEVRDLDVQRKQLEALSEAAANPPAETGAPTVEPPARSSAPDDDADNAGAEAAGKIPVGAPSPLVEPLASTLDAVPHSAEQGPALGRDIAELRAHLQRKREKAARALQQLLTKRQAKAALAGEALLEELRCLGTLRLPTAELLRCAETVLYRDGLLGRVRLPRLDEEELHALRKSAKAARYLAETLPGSARAASAAARFEALQEAGGQWHDALELTRAARKFLGKRHALAAAFAASRAGALGHYREALRAFEGRAATPKKQATAKTSPAKTSPTPRPPAKRVTRPSRPAPSRTPASGNRRPSAGQSQPV